jgi:hypothetical protein
MAACHSLLSVDGWYGSPASVKLKRLPEPVVRTFFTGIKGVVQH